jgi:hypothetical protein
MGDGGEVVLRFEIALDGVMQNVTGDLNGQIPDQQILHRLLSASQKVLLDEELICITVTSDKYTLKISSKGALFAGVVTINNQN